jgi:predicted transcriptional regulator YheO
MKNKDLPYEFSIIINALEFISCIFGEKYYEFVIHDIRNPKNSLIYIKGNITGRSVGAPLTDFLLKKYKSEGDSAQDIYGITRTERGILLKTASMFIRNRDNEIIGSLGINIDITAVNIVMNFLNELGSLRQEAKSINIDFAKDVNEILNHILNQTMANFEKPTAFLTKEERLKLVKELDERGLFLIKGAVEEVASRLDVSKYTIYNYLDEIKRQV